MDHKKCKWDKRDQTVFVRSPWRLANFWGNRGEEREGDVTMRSSTFSLPSDGFAISVRYLPPLFQSTSINYWKAPFSIHCCRLNLPAYRLDNRWGDPNSMMKMETKKHLRWNCKWKNVLEKFEQWNVQLSILQPGIATTDLSDVWPSSGGEGGIF